MNSTRKAQSQCIHSTDLAHPPHPSCHAASQRRCEMAMPLSTVRLLVRRFQPASSPHACITGFFASAKNARHHRLCFSTRVDRNRVQYDSWPATGRLQYRVERASAPLLPLGHSTRRRGVSGVSSVETLPPDEATRFAAESEGPPGLVLVDGSMLLHRAHHRAAGGQPPPWWRQKGRGRRLCVCACVCGQASAAAG